MASDIADALGKSVRIRTSTEIDNLPFLWQLRDPFIHLLSNALDHGIEKSPLRVSKGKEEVGKIDIRVLNPDPGMCVIEIHDDGAGIDFARVGQRAVELGFFAEGSEPSNSQLLKVLFRPAFGSRSEVSELSGRAVGLDAVHLAITSLGGSIAVATKKNGGTKFTLRIPLVGASRQAGS